MQKCRIALGMLGLLCAVLQIRAADAEGLSIDAVRALLVEHKKETISSVERPALALRRIRESRPTEVLLELYEQRDSTVCHLGGVSWAVVCQAIGSEPCVPSLVRGLADRDPGWRAFSSEALGQLDARQAVPHLLALLEDQAVVQLTCKEPRRVTNYVGSPSVALFASVALARMGRSDGVDHLLQHAARIKAEFADQPAILPRFPLPHVGELKKLSGQDLGDELDALDSWKQWFEEHE